MCRQTGRQTESQTDRGVTTDRQTGRQAESQIDRCADRQTVRQRCADRGVQGDRETDRGVQADRETDRGVQADRQGPRTQDDVLVVGVEGEDGRGQQAGHGLVVPDDVVLPVAVHQLLVVDGEDGEPGGVLLLGHWGADRG